MINNAVEVNKREIEDALNKLISQDTSDMNDKVALAEYVIESIEEIIYELGGSADGATVVDMPVYDPVMFDTTMKALEVGNDNY